MRLTSTIFFFILTFQISAGVLIPIEGKVTGFNKVSYFIKNKKRTIHVNREFIVKMGITLKVNDTFKYDVPLKYITRRANPYGFKRKKVVNIIR